MQTLGPTRHAGAGLNTFQGIQMTGRGREDLTEGLQKEPHTGGWLIVTLWAQRELF